jgi:hypothetical protein
MDQEELQTQAEKIPPHKLGYDTFELKKKGEYDLPHHKEMELLQVLNDNFYIGHVFVEDGYYVIKDASLNHIQFEFGEE